MAKNAGCDPAQQKTPKWPGGDKAAVLEKTPTEGAKPEKSREDRERKKRTSRIWYPDFNLPGKPSVPFFEAAVAGFRGKVDGN